MQKNLVLERTEKQYIIRSVTTGEENSGIDAGFIRTVHRNLMRLYQVYMFVFARGKRAMQDAEHADFVVKIESGTKRQSEQYALFYALPPALYAKNAHDAMNKGGTASEFEDYTVQPVTVCAVEDMDVLTEKLSGIRCRTQKDFIASMRVLCRAVVTVETPFAMTVDVKNSSDMDSVLDFTAQYMLPEEKAAEPANPYAMFDSTLPAPVNFSGGIAKRNDAFSHMNAAGITPLMGSIPNPAAPRMGTFAASVPFEGERVHADAFGKIVTAQAKSEAPTQEEEIDISTAFDENAVLDIPQPKAAPAPKKKKKHTSPFWIGHETDAEEAREEKQEEKQPDAVIYEAGSMPFVAQTVVEEPIAEEPVQQAAEEAPVQAEKAPRETLILPGNVIDIFEDTPVVDLSDDVGMMAYRFDYFADHSTPKKRDRQLKSPFEGAAPTKKTETTVPDAHIDDLLIRPAKPAAEEPAQAELSFAAEEQEAPADGKKMHFVIVDGLEIAVFADANADPADLLEEAKRTAARINDPLAAAVTVESEETIEEALAEEAAEEPVVIEIEEAPAEEVAEEPVVIEIEEAPAEEAAEEPVVVEIEETPAEQAEAEPVAVEVEEAPAEEETLVIEFVEEPIEEVIIEEAEDAAEEPEAVAEEISAEIEEETAAEELAAEVEEAAFEEIFEEPVEENVTEEAVEELEEPEAAEEVVEEAPIDVPLFYTREAERSELDDELDAMVDQLSRPAPAPKLSQLDALMMELEQVEDTRATAVLPAQDLLWQQEEMARAAARQAEEEFAHILVQHSVEAAQQVMQEESASRDEWIDIDMVDEALSTSELIDEEILQMEDTIFSVEDNFSEEYARAAQPQAEPVAAQEESAVEEGFDEIYIEELDGESLAAEGEEDAQEAPIDAVEVYEEDDLQDEASLPVENAPYAYDVEVLVADEVSPQEAARIVEDYRRSVGTQVEDPWQQVRDQWMIPEPETVEEASEDKAAFIREEADAIADELALEEEVYPDMEPIASDDDFAARSMALYDQLRVMAPEYPSQQVRRDITVDLEEGVVITTEHVVSDAPEKIEDEPAATEAYSLDETESAEDYEIIVLDDEETEAETEDDVEIELYEAEEESRAVEVLITEETMEELFDETVDDIDIELYEAEEEIGADGIVTEETIEELFDETADDIDIELYQIEEETIEEQSESADDYEIIVLDDEEEVLPEADVIGEEQAAAEEITEQITEQIEEQIESADDYEIIVLDEDEEVLPAETMEEAESAEAVAEEVTAEPALEDEEDIVLDPETALWEKIMREMPESLRNSPMAARAAALLASMYRVDADAARISRQMDALNPQNDEEETRAIYGRTSVEEELPEDFYDEQIEEDVTEAQAEETAEDVAVEEVAVEEAAEQIEETAAEETEPAEAPAAEVIEEAVEETIEEVIEEEPIEEIAAERSEEMPAQNPDVIELGPATEETVVVEGELFIPADDAAMMDLPSEQVVQSYGYAQVETLEEDAVETVVEEKAETIEETAAIARDIFEQYDAMDMEEEPAEAEQVQEDTAEQIAEAAQDADGYDPMDDAKQYFVPSAVEMELEEEGYPGEIYDEHLLSYAAQAEEIEAFDRRMQEAYRKEAAAEEAESADEAAEELYEPEEEQADEDFNEDYDEDYDEDFDEDFDDADSEEGFDPTYDEEYTYDDYDDADVEDVYIEGVDELIDDLPLVREEDDAEEEFDEEFEEAFEESEEESEDADEDFYDTVIDELDDGDIDDFALEEERLAREQERLEAEIAEQERLIAESRASRAQLDELAAELDRSIARENLAAQRAAREQVERERFERTQQLSLEELEEQQADYQYAEVGEPMMHRTQGKKIARHRNKRWFR